MFLAPICLENKKNNSIFTKSNYNKTFLFLFEVSMVRKHPLDVILHKIYIDIEIWERCSGSYFWFVLALLREKTKHLTLRQDIELLAPQNALTNSKLRRKFGRDLGHSLNSNVDYRSSPKFSFGIDEIDLFCGVKLQNMFQLCVSVFRVNLLRTWPFT